jgi:hypothetical protein
MNVIANEELYDASTADTAAERLVVAPELTATRWSVTMLRETE